RETQPRRVVSSRQSSRHLSSNNPRGSSGAAACAASSASISKDTLTHAIEGYITRAAWALTVALHIKAIEIIAGALRGAVAGEKEA
ncbi:hypothetical protein MJL79_28240, partial [Salmonella enterica subsp. enterica serovar Montevideo]|nr:hypothetical protein [Salmonella enterica subsp. enterica serovar Montevideo]